MDTSAHEQAVDPSAQKVKAFVSRIVSEAAQEAGRRDVLENTPLGYVAAARRSYAGLMGKEETPLAVFLDHKHGHATKGMLITDRYIYSAHVPIPLPIDRVCRVTTEGCTLGPGMLLINGTIFLRHKTIDPLAVGVLTAIATEVRERHLSGSLITEANSEIAALIRDDWIRPASEAVAMGTDPAQVRAELESLGMAGPTAERLVQGLIAMTRPGGAKAGVGMIVGGAGAFVLAVLILIDPLMKLVGLRAANPIFFVLGALGGLIVAGVGVSVIRDARKRRSDAPGIAKAWKYLLAHP